jgi:hypothetical protein
MFEWLSNRLSDLLDGRSRKEAAKLLSQATEQLKEILATSERWHQLCVQQTALLAEHCQADKEALQFFSKAVALHHKWVGICDTMAEQLLALRAEDVRSRAENARLWRALESPKELQLYIAAGCSPDEAAQLAEEAPRGA